MNWVLISGGRQRRHLALGAEWDSSTGSRYLIPFRQQKEITWNYWRHTRTRNTRTNTKHEHTALHERVLYVQLTTDAAGTPAADYLHNHPIHMCTRGSPKICDQTTQCWHLLRAAERAGGGFHTKRRNRRRSGANILAHSPSRGVLFNAIAFWPRRLKGQLTSV